MVQAARTLNRGTLITAAGMVLVGLVVAVTVALGASGSPDAGAVLLVTPALILVSLPILVRRARLEGDRQLFWWLLAALLVKIGGTFVRYYVVYAIYGGVADAEGYHDAGVAIADRFRGGIFDTGLDSLTEENFIKFLTGAVYTAFGSSGLGGFVVFSWLGYWGLYFFYRAFTVGVPEGRRSTYLKLVFFLPSLVFWSSSIGKESWMTFALGIAAFGAARILSGRTWRGLPVTVLGLWLAALVRPHVAGLLGLGLVAGYLIRPLPKHNRGLAPLGKAVGVAVVAALALLLIARTDRFLERSAIETGGGVGAVLRQTSERTSLGGSEFTPSVLESPARAPLALVTVLFRPFPFEAHNLQTLAASAEAMLLLVLCLLRFRWILSAFRSVRRQPYVAMAIAYAGLFVLAFSGFANFGLLARERVQLLPLLVVLLCIPPRTRSVDPIEPLEV